MRGAHNDQEHFGRIILGLVVMTCGVVLLLDRFDVLDFLDAIRFWGAVPLAIGVMHGVNPGLAPGGRPRSRRHAVWLMFVGCWGLATELQLFGLWYHTSWPILIVGAGVTIVWASLERRAAPAHQSGRRAGS